MSNPAALLTRAVQRTQYNMGRVLKEAGLCKLFLIFKGLTIHLYRQVWIDTAQECTMTSLTILSTPAIAKYYHYTLRFLKLRLPGSHQIQLWSDKCFYQSMQPSGTVSLSGVTWTLWESVILHRLEMDVLSWLITHSSIVSLAQLTLARMWLSSQTATSTPVSSTTIASLVPAPSFNKVHVLSVAATSCQTRSSELAPWSPPVKSGAAHPQRSSSDLSLSKSKWTIMHSLILQVQVKTPQPHPLQPSGPVPSTIPHSTNPSKVSSTTTRKTTSRQNFEIEENKVYSATNAQSASQPKTKTPYLNKENLLSIW